MQIEGWTTGSRGPRRARLLLAATSVLALGGAVLPATAAESTGPTPVGGTAPERYALGESLHLPVRSTDGTLLDGWVHLPDVPAGTRVPVVLGASPYWGTLAPAAADIEDADAGHRAGAFPYRDLVARGYAVALYNSRGSGNSEGCTDVLGPEERGDMKVLVESLAGRPFSTGRVATLGKSYPGYLALAAAVERPRGLRLVVASNPVTDLYLNAYTPQGASTNITPPNLMLYQAYNAAPPVDDSRRSTGGTLTGGWARAAGGNVCPEVAEQLRTTTLEHPSDVRDAAFWRERNVLEDLSRSTTPVLIAGGFHDVNTYNYQEFDWWKALQRGPRRLLLSQGAHVWPQRAGFDAEVFIWLDHHLRGVGSAPGTAGLVEYQDDSGGWHADTAWPPAARREEVLHLAGDELAPQPGGGNRHYRTLHDVGNHTATEEVLADETGEPGRAPVCPGAGDTAVSATYVTAAVRERTVLAGHPMAYLRLTSDQPGGTVEVALYAVPAGDCGADGARYLGSGTADLRFHTGGFRGSPFPVGAPQHVRVDVGALAESLDVGERLLVVLSGGESLPTGPYAPGITVHADGVVPSQLVLPVVEGGFGGAAPAVQYPPRPHALSGPRSAERG